MTQGRDLLLLGRKAKRLTDIVYGEVRKRYGLRRIDIDLLLYLGDCPGATASEISRSLELNKGQISQAFDRLCTQGFLIGRADPRDRRAVLYEMTSKCNDVAEESRKAREYAENILLKGVQQQDKAVAIKVLSTVAKNIDQLLIERGEEEERNEK